MLFVNVSGESMNQSHIYYKTNVEVERNRCIEKSPIVCTNKLYLFINKR